MGKIRLLSLFALLSASSLTWAQSIILTSDQQLTDLAEDPDRKIDNSVGFVKNFQSLRDVVSQIKAKGGTNMPIAFDEFFRQYRDDKNSTRNLTPDMDVDSILARVKELYKNERINDIDGVKMSKGQMINLYMLSLRKQAE